MSSETPEQPPKPSRPKRVPMPKGIPMPRASAKPLGDVPDLSRIRTQNDDLRRQNEALRRQLAENTPVRATFDGGMIPEPPAPPPPEPPEKPIYGHGPYVWKGVVLMKEALTSGPYVLDPWAPQLLFRTPGSHPADAAAEYCRLAGINGTTGKVAVDLLESPAPTPGPAAA